MPRHHIIPKHEWIKRFGTLDGVNAPDNLVELTTQQHAHVHKLLYELNGNEYDRIASLVISGQIDKEEAIKLSIIHANTGNKYAKGVFHPPRSKESRNRSREGSLGNKNRRGKLTSEVGRENILKSGTCFVLGHTPWNKGKVGVQVPWNKGKIGIQKAWNKGLKMSESFCMAQSFRMKGKKRGKYKKH